MSQISDLFKRIKELEEQIQQNKDQQDTDYQNALDKAKAVETAQDSLKTNMTHVSAKIDEINKKTSDLKGMKIRAVPLPIYVETVNGLGGMATPVAFQELLGALKTGIVDGQENPIPTIYQMKFYEAQKFIMRTGHIRSGSFWPSYGSSAIRCYGARVRL